MGNHEKMMLDYYTAQNNNYSYFNVYDCYHIWVQNGGYVTLNQMDNLPEDDRLSILEAIKKLPLAKIGLEVNRVLKNGTSKPYTYYLVHASYGQAYYPLPSIITLSSVADSECKKMLWERKSYYKGQHKLTYTQKNLYQNVTLISGHTSTNNLKNKVPSSGKFRIDNMGKDGSGRILHSHKGHAINVDCGIYCKTPILGCLRLDDWAEFYIK